MFWKAGKFLRMNLIKLYLEQSEGMTYIENVPWFNFHFFILDERNKRLPFKVQVHLGTSVFSYDESTEFKIVEKMLRENTNNIQTFYIEALQKIDYNIKEIFKEILSANSNCWAPRHIEVQDKETD